MWSHKIADGDVVRNRATGQYTQVTRKDKVEQDVVNTLSTNVRSSNGLGSGLDAAVGDDQKDPISSYSFVPLLFDFQTLVSSGMERLRRAQRTKQFSQRTSDELIYEISPVQLWPDLQDTRNVRWKLDVTTVDGRASFEKSGTFRS
jgi:hypothetical protein